MGWGLTRVVWCLLGASGVCMTSDDAHVWLAPFTPGARHTVTVQLGARVTLGALRIWNYNKTRVHTLRGARWAASCGRIGAGGVSRPRTDTVCGKFLGCRHVDVLLDGAVIFSGEVRQAPGNVRDALSHAELLLFTGAFISHQRSQLPCPGPSAATHAASWAEFAPHAFVFHCRG